MSWIYYKNILDLIQKYFIIRSNTKKDWGLPLKETNDDQIVNIPIQRKWLLPAYQALAKIVNDEFQIETTNTLNQTISKTAATNQTLTATNQNIIDLVVQVANQLGAEKHSVVLNEIHEVYLQTYPHIGKGMSRKSFDATIYMHCINVKSRLISKAWLTRPLFKRVSRGRFMLLSETEILQFQKCVETNNSFVFKDEYDITDLRC